MAMNVVEKITTPEGGTQFRVRKSFNGPDNATAGLMAVEWLKSHLTRNPCYIVGDKIKMGQMQELLRRDQFKTDPNKRLGVFVLED